MIWTYITFLRELQMFDEQMPCGNNPQDFINIITLVYAKLGNSFSEKKLEGTSF